LAEEAQEGMVTLVLQEDQVVVGELVHRDIQELRGKVIQVEMVQPMEAEVVAELEPLVPMLLVT
jgi:hypothetical protein